jgi:DNA-binding MarR family transcriptional regulator
MNEAALVELETSSKATRVTMPTLRLLALMMRSPDRSDWYATDLAKRLRRGQGGVTMTLHRLLERGWLATELESLSDARIGHRRPRRYFKLTDLGRERAGELLREFSTL